MVAVSLYRQQMASRLVSSRHCRLQNEWQKVREHRPVHEFKPSPMYPALQKQDRVRDGGGRSAHLAKVWQGCVRQALKSAYHQSHISSTTHRPVHVLPSPEYPALHVHVRVVDGGARSVHLAKVWQGCVKQALISAE